MRMGRPEMVAHTRRCRKHWAPRKRSMVAVAAEDAVAGARSTQAVQAAGGWAPLGGQAGRKVVELPERCLRCWLYIKSARYEDAVAKSQNCECRAAHAGRSENSCAKEVPGACKQ